MLAEYNNTTDTLEQRITALIPTHPETLELSTPALRAAQQKAAAS